MSIASRSLAFFSLCMAGGTLTTAALAQTAVEPAGAPPADLTATVTAPAAPGDAPKPFELSVDSTNVAISAGGQFAGGNSQSYAGTGSGKLDLRRGANGFGASVLGNYAEAFVTPTPVAGTPTAPGSWEKSTENLQGKLRYDRYLSRDVSLFMQLTGTHDAFQAITFRLNVDPGVKVLVVNGDATRVWGEAGYDFQFDDNYTDDSGIEQAGPGGPALDGNGLPYVISRTDTIHSSRLFAGFHEAFNKEVQLNLGLEYLQGFGGSGGGLPAIPQGYTAAAVDPVAISLTAARLNFDALLAAHVGAGFSIGLGFSAKYNSAPLPGKVDYDTAGTMALIYSFSSPSAKPATCPCPATPPPPPETPPAGTATPPAAPPSPAAPPAPPPSPTPAAPPVTPSPTEAPAPPSALARPQGLGE